VPLDGAHGKRYLILRLRSYGDERLGDGGCRRDGFFGRFTSAKGCGRNGRNSGAGEWARGVLKRMKDEGLRMRNKEWVHVSSFVLYWGVAENSLGFGV
jgi:hypothetical protein